jgi:hypothetical protein
LPLIPPQALLVFYLMLINAVVVVVFGASNTSGGLPDRSSCSKQPKPGAAQRAAPRPSTNLDILENQQVPASIFMVVQHPPKPANGSVF